MLIIDAHQHYWRTDQGDYGWMQGDYAPLKRVFAPEHVQAAMRATGVCGSVVVQTWHSVAETRAFLALAEQQTSLLGVVGWVDLCDAHVATLLRDLQRSKTGAMLVGIRHMLHNEADEAWLLQAAVQRGLRALQEADLSFDLLLRIRELPAALRAVAAFPNLRFVVDHLAKPEIAQRRLEPWRSLLQGFSAERQHVWCKLSGLVTEANWQGASPWQSADFAPYIATALQVFGADRCMFGSDWPVCTLAASYEQVLQLLHDNLKPHQLDAAQHAQIFADSAIAAYRLDPARVQAAQAALHRPTEGVL